LPVHVDRDSGPADDGLGPDLREVVAVERDVEAALWHRLRLELRDLRGDALGQRHAAAAHADEHEVVGPLVALDDLVRDARDDAAESLRVDDLGLLPNRHVHLHLRIRKQPVASGRAQATWAGNFMILSGLSGTGLKGGERRLDFGGESTNRARARQRVFWPAPAPARFSRGRRVRPRGLEPPCPA
jgi:hypothetical protein